MRKMNLMLLAALAVCMAACGGKSGAGNTTQEAEYLTLKTEVQGSIAEFVSFPEEVKIKISSKKTEDEQVVNLVLPISIEVKTAFCGDGNAWFHKLSIVDQDYAELLEWKTLEFRGDFISDDEASANGVERYIHMEKGTYRRTLEETISVQDWENICKNGAFLIISDKYSHSGYKAYTGSSGSTKNNDDSSSTAVDDSGSEDWDSILDSYENYVDKYISLAKKAASGDADAISEYTELAEEAQELSSKLSKAKGELSSSQLSRYTKITQKMANAAK